jgi:uncharacterized protein YjiS (DUF1127 family)
MLQYLNKLIKKIEQVQERRVAYFMLTSLSDAQLKDIGVSRAEIRRLVYEG